MFKRVADSWPLNPRTMFLSGGFVGFSACSKGWRDLYTKEPFPQTHAGEQYTVFSRRYLSLSLSLSLPKGWQIHLFYFMHGERE